MFRSICTVTSLVLLAVLLMAPCGITAYLDPTQSKNAAGIASDRDAMQARGATAMDGRQVTSPLLLPSDLNDLMKQDTTSTTDQRQMQQRIRFPLKVEAGDSSVSLSWRLIGVQQRPGDPPPRFTLYYGTESGRYDKKLELGTVLEYKLRYLSNNQLYYLRVATVIPLPQEEGSPAVPEQTVYSNEVSALPSTDETRRSSLEKSYAAKTVTLKDAAEAEQLTRSLKQFGYDFFRNSSTTATPLDNVPVGPDYVIGPGDSLRIDIWGSVQARHELTVDRNGEISIPKVGTVKVWGVSFSQAQEIIGKAISRYFKGFEHNVSLGRLRTIQVYVVGEVESPGTYSIASTGTVINALAMAGGPSKGGSLRNILITRGGKPVQEIDLYDMFLAGDRSRDIRLENGDTVFVPVIGPVAAISGEVKRTGIYELRGKTTLRQFLAMVGGVTAAGDLSRIQVERFEGNASRVVTDFEMRPGETDTVTDGIEMKDRDLVKVFPVMQALRQVVSLQGNVSRPGEYQYRKGMRITDLLPSYSALLPDSHLISAQLTRLVPPDFHREVVAVDLSRALTGDPLENIMLTEQDTLKVFSRSEMEEKRRVAVNGMVVNPGDFDFYPNMTVRDLVAAAGSLKRNAYLEKAELTRVTMKDGLAGSERFDINLREAMAGDPLHNKTLQQDDVLIVRGIQEWLESTDRFVTLQGEVRYPGTYSIAKGEKLSSLLRRAGGFTEKAYYKGAKFTRKSVQRDQQKRMEETIVRFEQDILKKQSELTAVATSKEELEATKAALDGLQKSLEKLKTLKAEGRVVIALDFADNLAKTSYDLELQGGDSLQIPPRMNVVSVLGQVYNQTALIHQAGEGVDYYLGKAGGVTRDGDDKEMYIIRADGTVFSRQQSTFGIRWDDESRRWTMGSFMAAVLQPGDTLVVPQKIERTAWVRELKDITQILANVALTAGTFILGFR